MEIVDILYEMSVQHKSVKAFKYDRSARKGAGNALYPLVWVDDPIFIEGGEKTVSLSLNIDFLDIPKTQGEASLIQSNMMEISLEFVELLRAEKRNNGKYGVSSFSMVTLRDYYDDAAAGVRLSLSLERINPLDLCSNNFDPSKTFKSPTFFPNFSTDNPKGCAIFGDKELPKITL